MDVRVYDFGRNLKRQFCMKVSFADFLFERFTSVLLVWGIVVEMSALILLLLAIILFLGLHIYVLLFMYLYYVFIL